MYHSPVVCIIYDFCGLRKIPSKWPLASREKGNDTTITRQKTLLPVENFPKAWTLFIAANFLQDILPQPPCRSKIQQTEFFLWQCFFKYHCQHILGGANLKIHEHVPRRCTSCGSGWAWGKCEDLWEWKCFIMSTAHSGLLQMVWICWRHWSILVKCHKLSRP